MTHAPPPQTCYMHTVSKATSWQHPRDDYFKSLVTRNRERAVFVEAVLRNNSMYRFDEGNWQQGSGYHRRRPPRHLPPLLVYPSFRLRDPFFTAVRCVQLRVEALPDLGFISFGFGPSNFHKNEDCIPEDVANYFAYTSIGETYERCPVLRCIFVTLHQVRHGLPRAQERRQDIQRRHSAHGHKLPPQAHCVVQERASRRLAGLIFAARSLRGLCFWRENVLHIRYRVHPPAPRAHALVQGE